MLLGQDPSSGRQLLDGRGSAARADHLGRDTAKVAGQGPDDELLTIPQAASLLGVSPQYLRKVVDRTAAARLEADLHDPEEPLAGLGHPYLDAARSGENGHWQVTRGEVRRFAAERDAPTAVIGYDLTFSVPKSVSLLWARGDADRQAAIVAAVEEAVAAGLAYLEENAAFIQSPGGQPGEGDRAARRLLPAWDLSGPGPPAARPCGGGQHGRTLPTALCGPSTGGRCSPTPRPPATWPPPSCAIR